MLQTFKVNFLLRGLVLFLLSPVYHATSLGLTVHVVPLDSNGGKTVRAHFSVITPSPCPDFSSVCVTGEDCVTHITSVPFTGSIPSPGWCVRQWQKTIPSYYNMELSLGSETKFQVYINAGPKIRANNGKLNKPAFVALPPPLRARTNCPKQFHLSVKDLDGDKVKCRFASAAKGECSDCNPPAFIELNEDKCILSFTGNAAPGEYFIYLMAEDLIPVPKQRQVFDNTPLSSVPVHLSLSVEGGAANCVGEPVTAVGTPEDNSVMFVLPFQEVNFNINYKSELESVSEVAVVGPPDLYRIGFTSVGSLATIRIAWIRSENNLTSLLPICFVANTYGLQSELRCVWLYQREMRTLPAGTELTCKKTEMTLVLPVASLTNINLAELQLNSPTCPVTYNTTHLTAHIPLSGCGTKTVQAGSELVYTNTLKSVRPYTMVSRQPSLVLPLACRIPGVQVKGPQYAINLPTEKQVFGQLSFWLEFHLPGEGSFARFTATPRFGSNLGRARRAVQSDNGTATIKVGSRIQELDLYLLSNCSVTRAEMVVTQCLKSDTEDFADYQYVTQNGCIISNDTTVEVQTNQTTSKVYSLNLGALAPTGSTLFFECTIQLCIPTMPSGVCPDVCSRSTIQQTLVDSVYTKTYTIRSGPVSTVVTTPAPKVVTTINPAAGITNSAGITNPAGINTPAVTNTVTATTHTASRAPEMMTTSVLMGIILATIRIFL